MEMLNTEVNLWIIDQRERERERERERDERGGVKVTTWLCAQFFKSLLPELWIYSLEEVLSTPLLAQQLLT